MPRKLRYSATLGTFAVAVLLSGCRTWEPATSSPDLLIRQERPTSVRVTVDGGSILTLRNPVVVGDSIVAAEASPVRAPFAPPRTGVLYEDVRTVEVARFSAARTIGLAAVIVGASVSWARLAGGAGGSPPDDGPLPKQPLLSALRGLQLVWRIF